MRHDGKKEDAFDRVSATRLKSPDLSQLDPFVHHLLQFAMSAAAKIIQDERNPRGIPKALFIVRPGARFHFGSVLTSVDRAM